MKIVIAAAWLVLVVQLASAQDPTTEATVETAFQLSPEEEVAMNSCVWRCGDFYKCWNPCAKLIVPKFWKLVPFTHWGKKFFFIYKLKDGTLRWEVGKFGYKGLKFFGYYRYFDKCSGKWFKIKYIADKHGFRPIDTIHLAEDDTSVAGSVTDADSDSFDADLSSVADEPTTIDPLDV